MLKSRHIAQINVAQLKYDIDNPRLENFRLGGAVISRLLKKNPSVLWYEQSNDADGLFMTRSVWDSAESLIEFTYSGIHQKYMRRSSEWFSRASSRNLALWWVNAGAQPTQEEGLRKLEHIEKHGPSSHVFDFAYLQKRTGT